MFREDECWCVCGRPGPDRDKRRSGSAQRRCYRWQWNVSGLKLFAFKGKRLFQKQEKCYKQYGNTWLLLADASLPTVVVCCQEQTHNRRRERECVFVRIQDARSAGGAEIQQMWPLFILFRMNANAPQSRARAPSGEARPIPSCTSEEPSLPGDGVLLAWTGAAQERKSWSWVLLIKTQIPTQTSALTFDLWSFQSQPNRRCLFLGKKNKALRLKAGY